MRVKGFVSAPIQVLENKIFGCIFCTTKSREGAIAVKKTMVNQK
jgi:hypothetical protein